MAFGAKLKILFFEQRGIFFNALFFVYFVTLQPFLLRRIEGVIIPARADGLRYRGVERQGICPLGSWPQSSRWGRLIFSFRGT
jgi:hypothetical protein